MKSSLTCILLCIFLSACATATAEPISTDIAYKSPTPTALPTPLPTAIYLLNGQEEFELPEDNESIKAALGKMQELQKELIESEIIESNSTIISIWTNPAKTVAYGFVEVTSEISEYDKGTWIGYPLSEEGEPTFYQVPEGAVDSVYSTEMKRIEAHDEKHKIISSFIYFTDEEGYHLGAEWMIEGKYPKNVTPWAIEDFKRDILKLAENNNKIYVDPYFPKSMNSETKLNGLVVREFAWLRDYYEKETDKGITIIGRFVSPKRNNEPTDSGYFERTIGYIDEKGNFQPIGRYDDAQDRYKVCEENSLSMNSFLDLLIKQKTPLVIESWATLKNGKSFITCADFTGFPCRSSLFKNEAKLMEFISSDNFPFKLFWSEEIQQQMTALIKADKAQDLVKLMDNLVEENNLSPIPLDYLLTLD